MKPRTRSTTTVEDYRDWREFIALLKQYRVKFIIIGAHALAALGKPRHTGDLDVFVAPTIANVQRVADALRDFGLAAAADAAPELAEPNKMMILGHEPIRIDITNTISGVSFAEAWRGRNTRKIGGKSVAFLGRREFIKNKRAAAEARPARQGKDLADLAALGEDEKPSGGKRRHAPAKRERPAKRRRSGDALLREAAVLRKLMR